MVDKPPFDGGALVPAGWAQARRGLSVRLALVGGLVGRSVGSLVCGAVCGSAGGFECVCDARVAIHRPHRVGVDLLQDGAEETSCDIALSGSQ
eukprot:5927347-Prymnesium_polylepis.1